MIRPKIDTRPLDTRMRDLRVLISVLDEQKRQAEIELLELLLKAGIVRDQHRAKVTGDGGI